MKGLKEELKKLYYKPQWRHVEQYARQERRSIKGATWKRERKESTQHGQKNRRRNKTGA